MRRPQGGTRIRLFPKLHEGFAEPELVVLSPPPGTVGAGPSDAHMYVTSAVGKTGPYDPPRLGPPWRGSTRPPAIPSPDGHFDHLPVDSDEFLSAHMYGSVRRVLDIWEGFLGRRIRWYHAETHPRLELLPRIDWDNAQSGPGFIEAGARANHAGHIEVFALNFEIVAHETGHAIIFSEVGVPAPAALTGEYLAFHESFADLIALISVMFFDSVLTGVLDQSHGNLYVANMLNRIGELSDTEQIRMADNTTVMADLAGLRFDPVRRDWTDATGKKRNAHDLAQPLTGAIFDILVEIYQDRLAERGLIDPDTDARGWSRAEVEAKMARFAEHFRRRFDTRRADFIAALVEARDTVAACLAGVLDTAYPDRLSFDGIAGHFLRAAATLGHRRRLPAFRQHFLDRGIVPVAAGVRIERLLAASPAWQPASGPCYAEARAAAGRARWAATEAVARRHITAVAPIDRLIRNGHRDAGTF
ncbi:MAG TPA: hypothetical protein VNT30_07880 [Stellaceae bacterium]|nr:hypothetical protein [Stellaceae bacterium]